MVHLAIDERTGRPYGSTRIDRYLDNTRLTVRVGDEVDIVVYRETDLGFAVVINGKHRGLVYESDVFQDLDIGDTLKGYIKKIRDNNKIDVSLQPIGYARSNSPNSDMIFTALQKSNGFLPLSDKSAPELIYEKFGISKKAFKRAVGDLYKQRKITIEKDGIRIVD